MATETTNARGLENVVVTSTKLSAIDGVAGRLAYAGYDIHDLAERATFEEVFYLLWYGELPNAAQLRACGERLSAERTLSAAKMATLLAAWDRLRNGKEPVAPDASLGHAANFLSMLHGERPSDVAARA